MDNSPPPTSKKPAISIVVANWNGAGVIGRCVGSLSRSARLAGREFEIIVVDDASTDRSAGSLMKRFPEARILINESNLGFAQTVNRGVEAALAKIVILCNNDIIAEDQFISALIEPFIDRKRFGRVFGVSARTMDWESGAPNHLNMTGRWARGRMRVDYEDSKDYAPSHFIQGGACALRRDVFLRLGGFDAIFHPGYWEDYDVSYAAMKLGFSNWYAPGAVAMHIGQHSMRRRYGSNRLARVRFRNELLWHWVNVTDMSRVVSHCAVLGPILALEIWKNGAGNLKAFFEALRRLPAALRLRGRRSAMIKRLDKDILHSG
jgi:GT2 family glycosyltransferase